MDDVPGRCRRRARLESQHVLQTYKRAPVVFTRGEGVLSVRRRRAALSRPDLRRRRRVARPRQPGAGRRARRPGADARPHVEPLLSTALQGQVASRLASLSGLPRTFFCNSGTEAMEGCLKFARRYWHTAGDANAHRARGPRARVPRPDDGVAVGDVGRALPRAVRAAAPGRGLGVGRRPGGAGGGGCPERTAAIVIEAIQGEGGVRPLSPAFAAGRRATRSGGPAPCSSPTRCSAAWAGPAHAFGYQRLGLEPDLVAVGKALGAGMPVGAVARERAGRRGGLRRRSRHARTAATCWRAARRSSSSTR